MISPKVLALPIRQNQEDQSSSPSYSSTSPNTTSSSTTKPFIFIPRSTDNINIQPKTPTPSESKMTNFSIAAIMNNSGSQNRGVGGESGDLSSLASISESGIALTSRIHQQQLTNLREHAFLQLGRRGFDESTLSPLSKLTIVRCGFGYFLTYYDLTK